MTGYQMTAFDPERSFAPENLSHQFEVDLRT